MDVMKRDGPRRLPRGKAAGRRDEDRDHRGGMVGVEVAQVPEIKMNTAGLRLPWVFGKANPMGP